MKITALRVCEVFCSISPLSPSTLVTELWITSEKQVSFHHDNAKCNDVLIHSGKHLTVFCIIAAVLCDVVDGFPDS